MLEIILEIFVLVMALSVDSFSAGFAYGVSKTKTPLMSVLIVSFISSITLVLSLFAGKFLQRLIPISLADEISFLILFILGVIKLLDHSDHDEAAKANKDGDDILSPAEALTLGIALSIDSIAAGIGAGVMTVYIPETLCTSLIIGSAALILGSRLGCIVSNHFKTNLMWVSGTLLIALAFMKLF